MTRLRHDITSALLENLDMRAIVAATSDLVIGNNNKIPWEIKEEMAFFRQTTLGGTVLMGRKTFESIGHLLPNRHNIILTRNKDFYQDDAEIVHSPEQLLDTHRGEVIWICGGANVYSLLLRACRKLYFSEIFGNFEGDSYFPKFDDFFDFERNLIVNNKFKTSLFNNKLAKSIGK